MNYNPFVRIETETMLGVKPIFTPIEKEEKPQQNPKLFFGIFILIISLLVIYFVANTLTEPNSTKNADAEKLNELVDKVVKGEALQDSDWAELCALLSKVKGVNINSCDSCRHYLRALLGGKHSPFLQNYLKCTNKELQKGIYSYDKPINLHNDKIANPKKYVPDWDDLDIRKREGTIKKWQKDIDRQTEQRNILECILKNR